MADALNVLIVEDVVLVALDMGELLSHAGFKMVGPAHTVGEAIELIDDQAIDVALVDVNLNGVRSDRVADRLADGDVPFAFITGYAADSVPAKHRKRPIVHKPFRTSDLVDVINRLCGKRSGSDD